MDALRRSSVRSSPKIFAGPRAGIFAEREPEILPAQLLEILQPRNEKEDGSLGAFSLSLPKASARSPGRTKATSWGMAVFRRWR